MGPRRVASILMSTCLAIVLWYQVQYLRALHPPTRTITLQVGGPAAAGPEPTDRLRDGSWRAGADTIYDEFVGCPKNKDDSFYQQWQFTVDAARGEKRCTLTTTPGSIKDGVPWGPISSYNWNGDFGYWYDDTNPGVRAARRCSGRGRCHGDGHR
jgi:hypothetical protein